MLRTLWRLLLGSLGLTLAIPLGSVVLGAGLILDPPLRGMVFALIRAGLAAGFWDLIHTLSPELVLGATVAVARSGFLLITLPPLLAAVIGETLRFRALGWYAGASGLITAGLPWVARSGFRLPSGEAAQAIDARATALLLFAGASAGFAYWLVAGWSAGGARQLVVPPEPEATPLPAPSRSPFPGPKASCSHASGHDVEQRTVLDQLSE